jgi:predicted nucleic acid-binding protein
MTVGRLRFLLSEALLGEYASVLLRPSILHQGKLGSIEGRTLISRLARNGEFIVPAPHQGATPPDVKDTHLWAILKSVEGSLLVTGDRTLRAATLSFATALLPREFVDKYGI